MKIDKYFHMYGTKDDIRFEEVPAARWIPCSERLPEPDKRYLVTIPLINGYPYIRILTYGHTEEGRLCWHEKDFEADIEMRGITAWQPLPEPYKGAKMEEEK